MLRVRQQSDLRCPYCLGGLPRFAAHVCGGCRTQLHPDCALELSACPTIGCDHEPRATVGQALTSLVQDLELAEEALAHARTSGDAGIRLRAERAHAAAREAFRAADRAAFRAHGVSLHSSLGDPAARVAPPPQPEPEPERDLTLWFAFPVMLVGLGFLAPRVLAPLNLSFDPLWGTLGLLGGALLLTLGFGAARRSWIEGAPYS